MLKSKKVIKKFSAIYLTILLVLGTIFVLVFVIPYYCIYGEVLSKSYQEDNLSKKNLYNKDYSFEASYSIAIFDADNQTNNSNIKVLINACSGNSSKYSNVGIALINAYENLEDLSDYSKYKTIIENDYSIFDSSKAMYLCKTNRTTINTINRDDFFDNIFKLNLDYSNETFKSTTTGYFFYDHLSEVKTRVEFSSNYETDLSINILNLSYKIKSIKLYKYDPAKNSDRYKTDSNIYLYALTQDNKRIEISINYSKCNNYTIENYMKESRIDIFTKLFNY